MPLYDFDSCPDRSESDAVKWDAKLIGQMAGTSKALPMWVADMEFSCAPPILQALRERVEHGVLGYPTYGTYLEVKKAFISWCETEHSLPLDAKTVCFSLGLLSGISQLVSLLAKPGDSVLIQTPAYRPFYSIIEEAGMKVVENPLAYDEKTCRYSLDLEGLEKLLIEQEIHLMIFCSPHNPAGRVWEPEELNRLLELCRRYEVAVISDEIHADLAYEGRRHIPMVSLQTEQSPVLISCMAPSKTFNIAGEHFSFLIIPDEKIRSAYRKRMTALHTGTPALLSLAAVRSAYEQCGPWKDELVEYLQKNVEAIEQVLAEQESSIRLVRPEASFIAFLDCRELLERLEREDTEASLGRFFGMKAEVLLHDGLWFGPAGKGFARINFALPRKELVSAMKRICQAAASVN